MYAMGIDPGLTCTAWAWVEVRSRLPNKYNVESYDAMTSGGAKVDLFLRMYAIASSVGLASSKKSCLQLVFIERPFLGPKASVSTALGCFGTYSSIAVSVIENSGIVPIEVAPTQVKSYLCISTKDWGNKDYVAQSVLGKIEKPERLRRELSGRTKVQREAVYDAIGIALTGLFLHTD